LTAADLDRIPIEIKALKKRVTHTLSCMTKVEALAHSITAMPNRLEAESTFFFVVKLYRFYFSIHS
jgi:hypothetical protein